MPEEVSQQELEIAFGRNARAKEWTSKRLTWSAFAGELRKVRRTSETMAQYDAMTKEERAKVKEGRAFVGGLIEGDRRRTKQNVTRRYMITLDVDFGEEQFIARIALLLGCTYIIYSTHSHRGDGRHKYRLIILLDRWLTADQYAAVARKVAELIGMHYFDKTTFDVNRLMYLPSCSADAEPVFVEREGEPLSADYWLGLYTEAGLDWRDVNHLPRHPEERNGVPRSNGQGNGRVQSPLEKRHIIGAFNRAFSVEDALERFLGEHYTPGSAPNRYTYTGGESRDGLEVFPEQGLVYSHQDSDPLANGHSHNAFDMVRIHRFGHLDDWKSEMGQAPEKIASFKAMSEFADDLPEVREQKAADAQAELAAAFDSEEGYALDWDGKAEAEAEAGQETSELPAVREGVGHILPPGARLPDGWRIRSNGVFKVRQTPVGEQLVPVTYAPVVVSGRYSDIADSTQGLVVGWVGRNGASRELERPRDVFADSKKIIGLSGVGFPVHSENAKPLTGFIAAFEAANEDVIPMKRVSSQLGWIKGGFLLGNRLIENGTGQAVTFMPRDDGETEYADGFHKRGETEQTLALLERVKGYPTVVMAVYAALSAPLLYLWDESPYIFELAGSTSRGKTTALRIAASLYGRADEFKPGFFKQWNMTKVSIERYASTMNHLPLFLDDTKKALDPRIIAPLVYQLSNGQGKGRGSLKGSQAVARWQTVLLSSGEQKLTSFGKDGGSVGRVLTLEGSPFHSADIDTALLTNDLNRIVSEHYGHIGEVWIWFLMSEEMTLWKNIYQERSAHYLQEAAGAGEVAMRLSRIMALIDVTGQMFDACLMDYFVAGPLYDATSLMGQWQRVLTSSPEMDRAQEALESVMGFVASKADRLLIGGQHVHGHFGEAIGDVRGGEYLIISSILNKYLEDRGYAPGAIAKEWKDRGWLKTKKDKTTKEHRINGVKEYAYHFDKEATGWDYVKQPTDYSEMFP